ncbi:MAG TPA: DsbA family protein [Acidimicrobiales bacterium]|nr:DsbA family protein [Acidimicrobiales bacterium]
MKPFSVNWDYRCPFARNAHEHIVTALEAGADWTVTFNAFSLNQVHAPEGGTPVWEDPAQRRHLLALAAGVVVRDQYPELFLRVHRALFNARHDEGLDLRETDVVAGVLEQAGAPSDKVLAEVESGAPLERIGEEHMTAVNEWSAFGVPTFVVDGNAAFVRLMSRPGDDEALARQTIEGVIELFDRQPDLNEFKHTTLAR